MVIGLMLKLSCSGFAYKYIYLSKIWFICEWFGNEYDQKVGKINDFFSLMHGISQVFCTSFQWKMILKTTNTITL
jgi:hypothetical protein